MRRATLSVIGAIAIFGMVGPAYWMYSSWHSRIHGVHLHFILPDGHGLYTVRVGDAKDPPIQNGRHEFRFDDSRNLTVHDGSVFFKWSTRTYSDGAGTSLAQREAGDTLGSTRGVWETGGVATGKGRYVFLFVGTPEEWTVEESRIQKRLEAGDL